MSHLTVDAWYRAQVEEYESEPTEWDYTSEAFAETLRDMEAFNASDDEDEPTEAELARWAEDERLRVAHRVWEANFEEAGRLAGDLPW